MSRKARFATFFLSVTVFAVALYLYGAGSDFRLWPYLLLIVGSGLLITELYLLRRRSGWSLVWYWQLALVVPGAFVSVVLGSTFTTSSGPAGGIPVYIALGAYSCLLLLGPVWTRVLGIVVLAVSVFAARDLRRQQPVWEERLRRSVEERDMREGAHP